MKSDKVLDLIRELAANNGSYSRLLEHLLSMEDSERLAWLGQFSDCDSTFAIVRKLEGW